MKILSALLLCLLVSLSAVAAELQAEFNFNSDVTKIKEGDLVEGTLKVWPIENVDPGEFKKLENTTLFNSLAVIQVHSVEPSANNADVTEVKALFLAKAAKEQSLSQINYKGQFVTVQAPGFKVEPLGNKSQDFYVEDQALSYSNAQKIILAILLVVIVLGAIWKREKIKEFIGRFSKNPVKLGRRKYNQIFSKAAKREDYEEIYAQRKEWLAFIEVKAPAYNEFFKIMNQHQYKRSWGKEELSDVQASFDIIRGSFK